MTQQSLSLTDTDTKNPRGTTGCARCDARWGGYNTAHCGACHITLTGITAFDAHRAGSHAKGQRHCVDPESVGLVDVGRAYPCWGFPTDDTDWASAFDGEGN